MRIFVHHFALILHAFSLRLLYDLTVTVLSAFLMFSYCIRTVLHIVCDFSLLDYLETVAVLSLVVIQNTTLNNRM
jgi:hypothetical protein